MRPVIDHLNQKFSEVPLNDSKQSIDEHKGEIQRQILNEVVHKIKTKKWCFKLSFCCLSESFYLYQMDIYLGRKQTPELNLGLVEEVVLQLTKDLKHSF